MIRRSLTVLALSLLTAPLAQAAAPMSTPPIPTLPGLSGLRCIVANVGTKDAEVTVEIVDAISGMPLVTVGPATLAPNIRAAATDATATTAFCRVAGLTKKNGTVVFYGVDAMGNSLMSVTAP